MWILYGVLWNQCRFPSNVNEPLEYVQTWERKREFESDISL